MTPNILTAMTGSWAGGCRTWFRPGELADESAVSGEISSVLNGNFFRHEYTGSMEGRPRHGEETIAFNPARNEFQVSWIDDFHMSEGILFSQGAATENGFTVFGHYDIAPGEEPWGWRTVYELEDPNHLTITAYNVLPTGEEAKAVETKYVRKS